MLLMILNLLNGSPMRKTQSRSQFDGRARRKPHVRFGSRVVLMSIALLVAVADALPARAAPLFQLREPSIALVSMPGSVDASHVAPLAEAAHDEATLPSHSLMLTAPMADAIVMKSAGITLTSMAAIGIVFGVLGLVTAAAVSAEYDWHDVIGTLPIILTPGFALAAAGVPLWVVGEQRLQAAIAAAPPDADADE